MKTLFTLFFLSVLIISCKKNTEIQKNIVAAKLYNLPNDEFREKVIPKLRNKDDRKILTKLSKSLDQKNMSICQFIKREFEIDDSCFAVAKEKYTDPEMQVQFMKIHDSAYEIAQSKFLRQVEITEHNALILIVSYSFNENVSNFCGKY
jgi:hypothetical protein